MNVLLFNPPGPEGRAFIREGRCTQEAGVWAVLWPPVTLATAAALLEADGHRVQVVDFPAAGLGLADLKQILRAQAPDVAAWSTGTPTLPFDLGLARLIKENAPAAFAAVLGTHVSVQPEAALACEGVDAVLRGEPEGILRDLCRVLDAGGTRELAQVRGLSWRDGKGQAVRHNPDAEPLPPEAIPAPAWHLADLRPYRLPLKGRPFLIVAPIRGCPYGCSFCTAPLYYGAKLRKRPIEQVMAEIASAVDRFGAREIFLWADTFTADRRYVREFCETLIERRLGITWTCNSRVDTVDEKTFALMKKAGLWMVSFGIESGSDRILKACGKRTTVAQAVKAVETAHRLGIRTAGHFILGLPGETEETMAQTLALALSLPLDVAQFYAAAPFPGTRLYDEALRNGWLRRESMKPMETREPRFCGHDGSGPHADMSQSEAVLELPGLSAARVDAFRREAYRRFYLRPQAILRTLTMLEPRAALQIFATVRRFLHWI